MKCNGMKRKQKYLSTMQYIRYGNYEYKIALMFEFFQHYVVRETLYSLLT